MFLGHKKEGYNFIDFETLEQAEKYILFLENKLEAISITRCCTELKVKEKMSFGQWKFKQGLRYISDHTYRNAKGELFDTDVVNKTYDDYYNL